MIACLQRVSRAEVRVAGESVGSIGRGLLVLLGVAKGDSQKDAKRLAERVAGYRCFPNEDGSKAMDRSLLTLDLAVLCVSQFTLCADTKKGMRPGFEPAALPEDARVLYEYFVESLRGLGVQRVETGRFRASMEVEIVGDGPITLWLDTRR